MIALESKANYDGTHHGQKHCSESRCVCQVAWQAALGRPSIPFAPCTIWLGSRMSGSAAQLPGF